MFTTRSLRDYMFKNFLETTDRLISKCDELMLSEKNVNMYDMFLRLTFEAFTNSAFGIDVNAIQAAPKVVPFANAFDKTNEIIALRYFSLPFVWKLMRYFNIGVEAQLKKYSNLMEAYIQNVICKRKEYFASIKDSTNTTNDDERKELQQKYDLLSLFIKDNPNINDKELRDITMNFIIAGRDTTAQLLSWFIYEMTKLDENGKKINGDIENKIREEINRVCGVKNGSNDGSNVSYESMKSLKYLECAFLETLRLHPSVPHLVRKAVSDIKYKDYIIRKGDEVMVAAYAMARLGWNWDNPYKFNPQRFYDNKNNKIIDHSASKFVAFNLNPRLCLGKNLALLEAKICIVKLFTKYKNIEMIPNQQVTYIVAATNQMKDGIKLSLK